MRRFLSIAAALFLIAALTVPALAIVTDEPVEMEEGMMYIMEAPADDPFGELLEEDPELAVDEHEEEGEEPILPGYVCAGFMWDNDYYLSDDEWEDLEAYAMEISAKYECGVYGAIVEDMGQFGYDDIEEFAEDFYEGLEFGYGEERTGILLILSMADRDYDIDAFGPFAHTTFTDYGKEQMADEFLPYFANDDWYNGFGRYMQLCEEYLEKSVNGEPVDIWIPDEPTDYRGVEDRGPRTGLAAGISGVIGAIASAITCGAFKSSMKTARAATEAGNYVAPNGVNLTEKQDTFLYSNVVRERIPDNNSRSGGGGGHYGGTTVHSSGHSHHSGKF